MAALILAAEIPSLSQSFQALFVKFNRRHFSAGLPNYEVRVVFDLHIFADEPIYDYVVSSGLIRFQEQCIYLRYTSQDLMEQTLIHEMAHAATNGEHGEEWLSEMRRLRDAGAPVTDWELEP